ncbi:Tubulin-tyrosine ligase/Tubulin polyglutamylase [Carpediemonas membranifera]|uniref:Tubulin-tyrosine ligase/Tubulin polyglutamylase n=1 Tax=Carpediemonas membranifera TaxID=201153 RepID=A0A8J6AX94_9EUKA|nr:Tubulin-tyrosine ligase/Tubulin polyglutamylase [Carpediemonas membranifera]|eukprot:KAG9394775.1 Tubulin-tyrosine ligase/Tubulin polyglutamylase [Carpediemonas membranifera]
MNDERFAKFANKYSKMFGTDSVTPLFPGASVPSIQPLAPLIPSQQLPQRPQTSIPAQIQPSTCVPSAPTLFPRRRSPPRPTPAVVFDVMSIGAAPQRATTAPPRRVKKKPTRPKPQPVPSRRPATGAVRRTEAMSRAPSARRPVTAAQRLPKAVPSRPVVVDQSNSARSTCIGNLVVRKMGREESKALQDEDEDTGGEGQGVECEVEPDAGPDGETVGDGDLETMGQATPTRNSPSPSLTPAPSPTPTIDPRPSPSPEDLTPALDPSPTEGPFLVDQVDAMAVGADENTGSDNDSDSAVSDKAGPVDPQPTAPSSPTPSDTETDIDTAQSSPTPPIAHTPPDLARSLETKLAPDQEEDTSWGEESGCSDLVMDTDTTPAARPAAAPSPPPTPPEPAKPVVRITKSREEVSDAVRFICGTLGFAVYEDDGPTTNRHWDILWSWKSRLGVEWELVTPYQRANHLPEIRQLTSKGQMAVKLRRFVDGLRPNQRGMFQISPPAFVLPHEFTLFTTAQLSEDADFSNSRWILKPTGKSRGRGITLATSINDVVYTEECALQLYIPNPLTYRGHKFDIRCYAVVTQRPLKVHLYRSMYGRMAAKPYSMAEEDAHDQAIHLTNTSLADDGLDSKMDLDTILEDLTPSYPNIKEIVWREVVRVVTRMVTVFETPLSTVGVSNGQSFELLGLDILIDTSLRGWLIEVNSSPSIAIKVPSDHVIKAPMLCAVFRHVGLGEPLDEDWVGVSPMRRK